MSGSIGLSVPSYLPRLFGATTAGDSLLATLYGQTSPSAATNPIAALSLARAGETKQVALVAAEPEVKRDLAGFTRALAKAATPADLLNDPTALKVLLTANGLGDQAGNTALARRVLLSDPSNPSSLVNKMTDTRWKPVVQTFAFASKGIAVLKNPTAISTIQNGYAEVLWRQSLDQTTPGLSNALDFLKRASTITGVDQILGDPVFRDVVTTALNVPREIAFQSLTAQEDALARRVDITKFKDTGFVNQFTQRYLINAAQNASANTGQDLTGLAVRAGSLVV